MGKVGGAAAHGPGGDYMGVPEEVTPFVMAGGQGTPYRDNTYNNGTYSSTASEATLGLSPSLHPQPTTPYSPYLPQNQNVASPPASAASFDPYNAYANVPVDTSSAPSNYSTATTQPPLPGPSARAGSVSGSGVGSAVAGPSTSAGVFTVANPSAQELPDRDVKQGAVPPQSRQTSVFQHADISDVVELPPAYKERD